MMSSNNSLGLQPPRRVTIVEAIIEQLVSLIQNGSLEPGDKLPAERKLMEMLNVSRSSVREALQGLAAMGLVEQRAGEGTFVKAPRLHVGFDMDIAALSSALQKEMRHHLNQARLMLELDIVALAAEKATEEDRRAIVDALEDYEAHGPAVSEDRGWPAHDRFHIALAGATQNPILVLILQSLLDLVPQPLRRGLLTGTPEQIAERIRSEKEIHRHLCDAVIRGDVAGAQEWMMRHARNEDHVIDIYYQTGTEKPAHDDLSSPDSSVHQIPSD
jgi:GntR family transcriptional regulator, transcriptional repressor for pyruvate dehydrogenase complex